MSESTPPRTNYPSNAQTSKKATVKSEPKTEDKNIQPVTVGISRKKSVFTRFKESLVSEDANSVGQYVLVDVLLPAFKTMVSDALSQGVERLLFGDIRPRSGTRSAVGQYTPYNRMHAGASREEPRTISRQARVQHNFTEIILETRGEAEMVLERLNDLISQYDFATVSDLYELVSITGSFTDDKWGWNDLKTAGLRRVREGWLLDLPPTIPAN